MIPKNYERPLRFDILRITLYYHEWMLKFPFSYALLAIKVPPVRENTFPFALCVGLKIFSLLSHNTFR